MKTMLKASVLRGVLTPIKIKSIDGNIIHIEKGLFDRNDIGYYKYFNADQKDEAMKWINHQRKKWGKKLLTKKEME